MRASHSSSRTASAPSRHARAIEVEGVVQGVGFRPFVWRLARELGLDGRVRNAAGRVEIEVAGDPEVLAAFERRVATDAPPRARVERVTSRELEGSLPSVGQGFVILESVAAPSAERLFPPDIATCDACVREVFDAADRRYRYPFTNCTDCGPRATIIDSLPYDRERTSMREFALCPDCEREYRDPADRRFHAEPVACPVCGPRLAYRRAGSAGAEAFAEDALGLAVTDLRAGRIVAVKGLGGYHLACDATDEGAVARLRDRKRRWAKPFAVMVRDLATARGVAVVDETEAALLAAPTRPIVLVPLRKTPVEPAPTLAPGVTNGNRRVGLFLPYTPLHHLLLEAVGRPIVLTSGNLSDEPIVTDDDEALERLGGLADAFLQHDRRIRARYDDSVTRVVGEGSAARESIVRRGRGYAPEPLDLPIALPDGMVVLATGAELKHTFAIASRTRAHVAPHIGDLEDLLTHRAFEENLAHLSRLLDLEPGWVAHDLHPAYLSTQYAARFPAERRIGVQHHHAHVASCAAEHGIVQPFIGVAYDGLGMGDDGSFWGGEIMLADLVGYRRVGRFASAPMPGGALAVKKPYRMALGYLLGAEAVGGDGGGAAGGPGSAASWRAIAEAGASGPAAAFLERLDPREVKVVGVQLARELNAPRATSAGRLFDAAASLLGLRDVAEFEAQAAIDLEMAAAGAAPAAIGRSLPFAIERVDGLLVYDPRPTLAVLIEGLAAGIAAGDLAAGFQATIATVTRELCAAVRADGGPATVCLSGGVFQNQWLADELLTGLAVDGFEVHINERVPVNDGGISYGQAAVAAARVAAAAGGG